MLRFFWDTLYEMNSSYIIGTFKADYVETTVKSLKSGSTCIHKEWRYKDR